MILHVGTGKTGSSSLQRSFESNVGLLRTEGVYYPTFFATKRIGAQLNDLLNKELLIAAKYKDDAKIQTVRQEADDTVQKLLDMFLKSGCRKMLITDERLWRPVNIDIGAYIESSNRITGYICNDYTESLFEEFITLQNSSTEKPFRLKQLFKDFDVKVIYYLRRQDLWAESSFNQRIKQSGIIGLKKTNKYRELIKDWYNYPFVDVEDDFFHDLNLYRFKWMCYYENLCIWADVFGKENIIVKPFEKDQFREGRLIKDFFVDILKIDENKLVDLKELRVNENISRDLIEYLIKYDPPREQHWDKEDLDEITRKLNNANAYKNYYTDEERMQLLNYHKDGNSKIAREFLGREDGTLFYEEIKIKQDKYPGLTDETKTFLDKEFARLARRNTVVLKLRLLRSRKELVQQSFAAKGYPAVVKSLMAYLYIIPMITTHIMKRMLRWK